MIYILDIENLKLHEIDRDQLIEGLGKSLNTAPNLPAEIFRLYYELKYTADPKMLEAVIANLASHEANK